MDGDRGMSLLVESGQWADCTFTNTAPLAGGGVELDWRDSTDTSECGKATPSWPGGLTFDKLCRAFRSRPGKHAVDVLSGGTRPCAQPCGSFAAPLGLAVDRSQRLCIADSGENAIWVIDLETDRLLRRVPTCGTPIDVAPHCDGVIVLLKGAQHLYTVAGRRGPVKGPALMRPCYPHGLEPIKIASGPFVLWRCPDGECVVATPDGSVRAEVVGATDVDLADGRAVVARAPDQSFARFAVDGSVWTEIEPLRAPGYDGGALGIDPRGHVAFTRRAGIGWTTGSAARHVANGTLVTHRMDSGDYRTRWGRVFLDACIPRGTTVRARFVAADDDEMATPDFDGPSRAIYRRPTGRERPWAQIDIDDRFDTYETPVNADRGRYLWIELSLSGTASLTPRIREVRVERPGHALLDALPKSWSRNDIDGDFLQRFLAPAEAMLYELDRKAALRAVLVDPSATPQEALAWLASFAGLTLDRRWSESARRTLIAEAYQLFRRRGTKEALRRIIGIYLGFPPQIIEQWQLRGIGGTVLGTQRDGLPTPTIGASVRETGTLGRFSIGGTPLQPTSFDVAAHRYTVLVRGTLTAEQRAVVCDVIRAHAPAHTLGTIQELGPGMRMGTLRVGLTSYIGPQPGAHRVPLGTIPLGRDGIVGTPTIDSRIGEDAITGQVRVG